MNNLVLLGFGGVGRALLEQALPHFRVRMVIDRSGYVAGDLDAMTLRRISAAKADGAALAQLPEGTPGDWRAALPDQAHIADTTADETGPLLIDLIQAGYRVALANKKPLCGPYAQFLALTQRRRLRYEATVGAGLPVVMTTQMLLNAGDNVQRIEGCFSGTLGFVISALQQGQRFSAVVGEAKQRGWTEPDPRDDLSGTDVARKALILGRTLGYAWTMNDISVEALYPPEYSTMSTEAFMAALPALDASFAQRQAAATQRDKTLRYVATITADGAHVGLQEVATDSPAGGLHGPDNLVAWTTAFYPQPLVVRGAGAGVDVTAAGVLFDLLALP